MAQPATSNQRPLERVIISGGGTGGHIFPAIAIADEVRRRNPHAEVLFVGALGRMEMQRVPAAGYEIVGLPIQGLQRSLSLKNLTLPVKLFSSIVKARKIIMEFRPQVAAGVGGYASGPTLLACRLRGVPYIIQEQNSYAGLTNKRLAGRASAVCTAYTGMESFFPKEKIRLTGNPVRAGIALPEGHLPEALAYFGLEPERPVLLVTGGSLGARTLNEATAAGLERLTDKGFQVIWQTGKAGAERFLPLAAPFAGKGVWANPFIDRMDLAYAAADVVIARAGALTVSELCLVGKAAILVPSPNVAEDHQTKNARALWEKGAAWLVSDAKASELLIEKAEALLLDSALRLEISKNVAKLALPNATHLIVDEMERAALP